MPENEADRPGRRIRSVEITFDVLEELQERGCIGVTTLSDALGYSKSTIHSHLRTLEDRKIVVRDGDCYRLSARVLDVATQVREQIGNPDVIREEVDALADESDEIAQFGIEEHGRVSYIYKAAGDRAVETRSRVGTQQPLYSTALGKTILAHLPADRRTELVETFDYGERAPNTITDPETLADELEAIRDRGYGIDDEENIAGLRCVAAPVKNEESILGAVSVSGPSSRFTDDRLHGDLADHVRRAANVIELNTKFS